MHQTPDQTDTLSEHHDQVVGPLGYPALSKGWRRIRHG